MLARGIDRILRLARDAGGLEIDQRQAKAALARLIRGAGEDDRVVRIHAIDHRQLRAVQLAAAECGADRFRRHRARALRCGRRCRSRPPSASFGQQRRLLLFAAGRQQRFGKQIDRGGERHRRQHAAQLLGHNAKFEIAEARARHRLPGSPCPASPSRQCPSTVTHRNPESLPEPRARLWAGTSRRGSGGPDPAASSGRRRNRNSCVSTRLIVCQAPR